MGGSLAYQVQNQGGGGQGADAVQPAAPVAPAADEAPAPSTGGNAKKAPATQTPEAGKTYDCEEQNTSLDICKDVNPVTDPGYKLSLDKQASTSYIEMWKGESAPVTFTIDVGAASSNSYNVSGKIYVHNTGSWPADVTAVSDTIWYKAGGATWLAASSSASPPPSRRATMPSPRDGTLTLTPAPSPCPSP